MADVNLTYTVVFCPSSSGKAKLCAETDPKHIRAQQNTSLSLAHKMFNWKDMENNFDPHFFGFCLGVCHVKAWHPRLSWKPSPFHPYSSLVVCWGSLLSELDVAYNVSIHVPLASHKVPLRWKGDCEIYISYVPRGKMKFLLVKRLPAHVMCGSYLIWHDFIQKGSPH